MVAPTEIPQSRWILGLLAELGTGIAIGALEIAIEVGGEAAIEALLHAG